jgi:Protein of unknown function (DUF1573)
VISPDPIELGVIAPGQTAGHPLSVRNPLSERVVIERIETSCPCIGAQELPIPVEPNQEKELEISFDPSEARDFRGSLSVDVTAHLSDGRVAFRTKVRLKVEGGNRNRPD